MKCPHCLVSFHDRLDQLDPTWSTRLRQLRLQDGSSDVRGPHVCPECKQRTFMLDRGECCGGPPQDIHWVDFRGNYCLSQEHRPVRSRPRWRRSSRMISGKPAWSLVIARKRVQHSAAAVSRTCYARRLESKGTFWPSRFSR